MAVKNLIANTPLVMGILNVTPDSFFDGGTLKSDHELLSRAEKMLKEGADILDIGGMSSRPGAEIISESEELKRVVPSLELLRRAFPGAVYSIDTMRSSVADQCLNAGAAIINDISAARFDTNMVKVVAKHQAGIILMHMQGMPDTMQLKPEYTDVLQEVLNFLTKQAAYCKLSGIETIAIDPGFGFGKTIEHNYTLLKGLKVFSDTGYPVLAGLSRKSMIYKPLNITADEALNGTTALNMVALINGASILRVHDVKEAKQTISLFQAFNN